MNGLRRYLGEKLISVRKMEESVILPGFWLGQDAGLWQTVEDAMRNSDQSEMSSGRVMGQEIKLESLVGPDQIWL